MTDAASPTPTVAGDGRAPRRGARLRRTGLGLLDQGLYSLGNFALAILVARSVSPDAFGAYAVVAATYLVAVATIRGLTSETFVVRFSVRVTDAEGAAHWRAAAGAAAGMTLLTGALAAVVVLALGLLAGLEGSDGLGAAAVAFAVSLPGLAVQDFWRFAALAQGRPGIALLDDVVSTGLQLAGAALLIALDRPSVVGFVLAWGVGGLAGALLGVVLLRTAPHPGRARWWWREHRDLAGRYAVDDVVSQGSQQASGYVVAAVGGLAQTGALRAAQTVFGPPSILNLGVMTAVTPELVRLLARSPEKMRRAATLLGLGLGAVAGAWGLAAHLLPDPVGRGLFGPTWPLVAPLLGFYAIGQVFNSIRVAPQAGLRALADARRTLRARWIVTVVALLSTVAAAATGDARTVAISVAVSTPVQAAVWWVFYRRAFADHLARRAAGGTTGTPAGRRGA